jgi:hypothetical protein
MTPHQITALGVDVAVRGVDGSARNQLSALWSDCAPQTDADSSETVELTPTDDGWRAVTRGQTRSVIGEDSAVSAASAAVNHLVVSRTPLLAFHAAVVSRDGVTMVVPGGSGAGKTTLTVALLQRGWSYVSDEALALDWETAALVPYPRPMAVSDWTCGALGLGTGSSDGVASGGETWFSAAHLDARTSDWPAAPSLVVLPDRRDGDVVLDRPHRAEALAALVPRAFTLHRDPARALELLGALCRGSDVVGLSYADPRAAADALTELVS